MIVFHRPVISSSAASQLIGANLASPLAPIRRSGVSRRSGECTSSASRLTLAQAKPAVKGCSGSPLTRNTRPSSTSANSEHMSGQSCAQTTRTVSKSHSGEIACSLSQKPDGPSTSLLIRSLLRRDLSPGTRTSSRLFGCAPDKSRYDRAAPFRRDPMADLLETSDNGITTLTLNRPERLNALSPAMTEGLKEALERLSTDRDCGAIVITGAGRGWCAGGDVKTMEARGRDQSVEDRAEGLRRSHQLPLLLRTMPKIVIAAINGPVAGAGLGLALACDLRIAGRSARFGTAFARIGYSGDYGGSWSLTRLVGTAKARELYFTADIIDAEEAGRLGIVNRVVADDELQAETTALARRIADGPRIALGYMKRNLLAAETEPFQTVLELEAAHQARCAFTEDHKEAVTAFNEKRRPVFKGQ